MAQNTRIPPFNERLYIRPYLTLNSKKIPKKGLKIDLQQGYEITLKMQYTIVTNVCGRFDESPKH